MVQAGDQVWQRQASSHKQGPEESVQEVATTGVQELEGSRQLVHSPVYGPVAPQSLCTVQGTDAVFPRGLRDRHRALH